MLSVVQLIAIQPKPTKNRSATPTAVRRRVRVSQVQPDDLQREARPGANVTKLFTAVIYHHSMVMPSFCVIKLCYPENYNGMAVNYHSILTLEKVGLKVP